MSSAIHVKTRRGDNPRRPKPYVLTSTGDQIGRPYKACPLPGHADAIFLPHPPAPSPKHQGRGAKLGGFRNNLLIFASISIFFVLIRYCPGFH